MRLLQQLRDKRQTIALCFTVLAFGLAFCGCQTIKQTINQNLSDHLAHWKMLEQDALEDPIAAVGGDGIVFTPSQDNRPLSRKQLATADPFPAAQRRAHSLQCKLSA